MSSDMRFAGVPSAPRGPKHRKIARARSPTRESKRKSPIATAEGVSPYRLDGVDIIGGMALAVALAGEHDYMVMVKPQLASEEGQTY